VAAIVAFTAVVPDIVAALIAIVPDIVAFIAIVPDIVAVAALALEAVPPAKLASAITAARLAAALSRTNQETFVIPEILPKFGKG